MHYEVNFSYSNYDATALTEIIVSCSSCFKIDQLLDKLIVLRAAMGSASSQNWSVCTHEFLARYQHYQLIGRQSKAASNQVDTS